MNELMWLILTQGVVLFSLIDMFSFLSSTYVESDLEEFYWFSHVSLCLHEKTCLGMFYSLIISD